MDFLQNINIAEANPTLFRNVVGQTSSQAQMPRIQNILVVLTCDGEPRVRLEVKIFLLVMSVCMCAGQTSK